MSKVQEKQRRGETVRAPTGNESLIIELVAQGLKNKDIASRIGTSEHVVKNYLRVIYDKLGMWNRVEVALWYESHKGQEVVENSVRP